MNSLHSSEYDKNIAERIELIMQYTELEIAGLAELTGLSIDTIYAILSGRRKLSKKSAKLIGENLDFDGSIIFNLNTKIPTSIKKSIKLQNFRLNFKENKEYFSNTRLDRKTSYFIKLRLIDEGFFSSEKFTWEVNEECEKLGKSINSNLLNKQLKYFVTKGILKSKRAPIKLKSGGYGNREVDAYFNH